MARAWVKQIASQIAKRGAKKASWYCYWDEPDGMRRNKSHGPGTDGKRLAEMHADRLNGEFVTGRYKRGDKAAVTWQDFVAKYDELHLSQKRPSSRAAAKQALAIFGRVLSLDTKPVSHVDAELIARFKRLRLKEAGAKPGSTVSPATVNKELRQARGALRKAAEWHYIEAAPPVGMLDEPRHMKHHVTPEDFAKIFTACKDARASQFIPADVSPADWWKALTMFAFCTGWRIGEILSLEWSDVRIEGDGSGWAITRAKHNKGGRDESVYLPPAVIQLVQPLRRFTEPRVLPWDGSRKTLAATFHLIQKAAGIDLPCIIQRPHECTEACHLYCFHDERRGFATVNAKRLSKSELQAMMRHTTFATTEKYIQFAESVRPAALNILVPQVG